jgi:Holliday junction resolvase-like predicted endonuclease
VEEIKLWKVGGSKESLTIVDVSSVGQTKTEGMLEEILVKSPNLLLSGLKLVGRQTETPGGPLDLLGVDEDGRLIVFELKKGTLTRDAVAQIVDYASYLAELVEISVPDLNNLISQGSGKFGVEKIDDFSEWYQLQFGKALASIGKPKMMLVGLGVDDRARRMVEFLANSDIEISLITFHGFDDGNDTYLARQIEVAQRQQEQSPKASKTINLQKLLRKVKAAGVNNFFEHVTGILRAELNNPYEWPNQSGYTYYLPDITESGTLSNHAYVSLSVPDNSHGSLLLTLQERAALAAGKDWLEIEKSWGTRVLKKRGYIEVKIASVDDWKLLELDAKKLCSSIVRGREAIREQQILTERQVGIEEAGPGPLDERA